jgi:phosphomevalonate kinase
LGIFDAGHAELVTAAEAAGLVYKPCGAGGGDVGILLGDDAAAVDSFIVSQLPEDCCRLNMQIDMQGVLVSQEMN